MDEPSASKSNRLIRQTTLKQTVGDIYDRMSTLSDDEVVSEVSKTIMDPLDKSDPGTFIDLLDKSNPDEILDPLDKSYSVIEEKEKSGQDHGMIKYSVPMIDTISPSEQSEDENSSVTFGQENYKQTGIFSPFK